MMGRWPLFLLRYMHITLVCGDGELEQILTEIQHTVSGIYRLRIHTEMWR
jgi:hypothetical protein